MNARTTASGNQPPERSNPSPFKRILIHVGRDRSNTARVDLGAHLADRFGGRIIGAYLSPLIIPAAFAAGEFPTESLVEQEKLAQENIDIVKRKFLDQAASKGLQGEWHCFRDAGVSKLRRLARYTDIAIVGQVDPDMPEEALSFRPEDLILASGRPTIVVPYIGALGQITRSIVIAWDGRREAARAVGDALPLLREAQSVQILSIDLRPEGASDADGSAPDLIGFLADHGVEAKSHLLASGDIGAADLLLSQLTDLGADLLVMGCYGHSRVRELFLGGMTKEILRHMTVPVFMSH